VTLWRTASRKSSNRRWLPRPRNSRRGILPAEWEAFIDDPGFFRDAYGDVEQIWQELLTKSGLTVFDTLTGGCSEMSFMEHVEEGA
jgi:hypothetical protein